MNERTENMISQYRSGATLQEIGNYHGITRERVRQILAKQGLNGSNGGVAKRAKDKKAAAEARRNQRCIAKHGMPLADYKRINAGLPKNQKPAQLFREQKRNANTRGIEWGLNFAEWWLLWSESGKWDQRGRGKGKYVMARHGDSGAYTIGNVKIIRFELNNSEYIRRYWSEVRDGTRPQPKGTGDLRTHCKRGHPFTEENTYRYKNQRQCRACKRIREQKRQAKVKAARGCS